MTKRVLGVMAAVALLAPAAAQAALVIHVSPGSVAPGGSIRIYGKVPGCGKGEQVTLISKGFKGSGHSFAGVPAVLTKVGKKSKYSVSFTIGGSVKAGLYKISGRCGGGLFGHGGFQVT